MAKVVYYRYHSARRAPVAGRDAYDAPTKCCPRLRHAGQSRLLFSGVLGRRDLRRLPALPERRPVGAPAQAAQGVCPTPSCRCCSAARTCWATSTMPTTWWISSSKSRIENGIDIIRIFDALNDPRNLETAIEGHQEVRRHLRGGHELHRQPRSYRGLLRRIWPSSSRRWARTLSASRIWPTCCCPTTLILW